MNAQAFSELMNNPALLANYSLWELQELAQQHPYSSVVHSLVALKAHLEGDGNYEHHLHQAALRIADRKKLFELIHAKYEPVVTESVQPAAEKPLLLDDNFETTTPEHDRETQQLTSAERENLETEIPLHEFEKEKPAFEEPQPEFSQHDETGESTPPSAEETEATKEEVEPIIEETKLLTKELTPDAQYADSDTPPAINLPGADEVLEALGGLKASKKETVAEDVEDTTTIEVQETKKKPPESFSDERSAHSFSEWLSLLTRGKQPNPEMQDVTEQESAVSETGIPEKPTEAEPAEDITDEEKEIDEIIITRQAKASLSHDDELVTETLAKIYELQKKYEKAIKAYQTLSLKYPDKRAYFADKIEKLKNK